MLILALETVTRAGSLALFTDRGPGPSALGDPTRTHGVRLPDELRRFAAADGRNLRDVDAFAVVTGPGSFTGLRIGLATIQGLALAGNCPVIGVPTLEAMASGWLDEHPGADGLLVACLDGAREDVFYAAYDVTGAASIETARVVIEPRVDRAVAAAAELADVKGPYRMTLTGSGIDRFLTVFHKAVPDAHVDTPMPNLAAAAAKLASRRLKSATKPHALRPIYIRRPDAELVRERQRRAASVFEVTTAGDIAEVARLQGRAFGNAWGAEALGSELANNSVARLYALRHATGEIVAYCAAWQILDELHINSLAVDPRYRRQGIARTLLTRVLAIAAEAGAKAATLEVRQSNDAGRMLYEGLGFRVEGVRPGYYQNPREDALILWRRDL